MKIMITMIMMLPVLNSSLLLFLHLSTTLPSSSVEAFFAAPPIVALAQHPHRARAGSIILHAVASPPPSSSSSETTKTTETTEMLQHDIDELKEQAAHRLDALLEQMEALKAVNKNVEYNNNNDSTISNTKPKEESSAKVSTSSSNKETIEAFPESSSSSSQDDGTANTNTKATKKKLSLLKQEHHSDALATMDTAVKSSTTATTAQATPAAAAPLDLLDDTVWKIVFNIGREAGTWMPKDWGISGDRLLFQCSVEFTSILSSDDNNDEFFQGGTGIKQLQVTDAFVIPRGVGTASVGRRPLPVKPTGAYKVCRGHGPAGTDIVRLYVELTDAVEVPDHLSDVYCPPGRVYGTCGYFPQHSSNDPSVATTTGTPSALSVRDALQVDHNEAVREYERLQLAVDNTDEERANRGVIVHLMDHLQKMRAVHAAKRIMEQTAAKLQVARQREPEKAQLRLNKSQTVGLTREGGVCCKVHKGLALEYHILGRMEVGCVEDHHHQHDAAVSASAESSPPSSTTTIETP